MSRKYAVTKVADGWTIYGYAENTHNLWICNDGEIRHNGIKDQNGQYSHYYFNTKEEAEVALIAAQLRGDAL